MSEPSFLFFYISDAEIEVNKSRREAYHNCLLKSKSQRKQKKLWHLLPPRVPRKCTFSVRSIFPSLIMCRIGERAETANHYANSKFTIIILTHGDSFMGNLRANFEWFELVTTAMHRFLSAFKNGSFES